MDHAGARGVRECEVHLGPLGQSDLVRAKGEARGLNADLGRAGNGGGRRPDEANPIIPGSCPSCRCQSDPRSSFPGPSAKTRPSLGSRMPQAQRARTQGVREREAGRIRARRVRNSSASMSPRARRSSRIRTAASRPSSDARVCDRLNREDQPYDPGDHEDPEQAAICCPGLRRAGSMFPIYGTQYEREREHRPGEVQ